MALDDTLKQIEDVNQIILASILVLVGCIVTFWGARLFKQIIFFIGFIAGTLFTYFIMNNIDINTTLRIHLLVSCGVGIFLGFICVMIYKMAVFTTGAIAGLIIGQFLWQFVISNFPNSALMEHAEIYNTITIIVCSLIGGLLAFKMMGVLLRGLTAFIGSFMVTSGIAYFVSEYLAQDDANVMDIVDYFKTNKNIKNLESQCHIECYVSLGIWAALFLSGAIYQYKCNKLKPKHSESIRGVESSYSEEEPQQAVVINNHNHYHQLRDIYD